MKNFKKLGFVLLLAMLLIPLASATITDLFITISQNAVVSSVPGAGQLMTAVQLTRVASAIATGGTSALAQIAGQFALSQATPIVLSKIVGSQAADTILQLKDYGSTLLKDSQFTDLKVNRESGLIESGSMTIKLADGTDTKIDLKNMNFKYDKQTGLSTYIFGKDGEISIGGNKFSNIAEGGKIRLDKTGKIESADFTTSAATEIKFEGIEKLSLPKGAKVNYNKYSLLIESESGKDFSFSYGSHNILSLDGGNVRIINGKIFAQNIVLDNYLKIEKSTVSRFISLKDNGYLLEGEGISATVIGQQNLEFIGFLKSSSTTFFVGKPGISENGLGYDNYIIPNEDSFVMKIGSNALLDVNLGEGNQFMRIDEGQGLKYMVHSGTLRVINGVSNIDVEKSGTIYEINGDRTTIFKHGGAYAGYGMVTGKKGVEHKINFINHEILVAADNSVIYKICPKAGLVPAPPKFDIWRIVSGLFWPKIAVTGYASSDLCTLASELKKGENLGDRVAIFKNPSSGKQYYKFNVGNRQVLAEAMVSYEGNNYYVKRDLGTASGIRIYEKDILGNFIELSPVREINGAEYPSPTFEGAKNIYFSKVPQSNSVTQPLRLIEIIRPATEWVSLEDGNEIKDYDPAKRIEKIENGIKKYYYPAE